VTGAEHPVSRREEITMRRNHLAVGAPAVALAGGLTAPRVAADEPKSDHARAMEHCLKECVRCAKECEMCFAHCTKMVAQGKKEHLRTLRTCLDCGEFCAVAAKLMARHGAFMGLMCEACAKACDACGAECEKFPNDPKMKQCADACKDCAKACRDMVKATGTEVTRGAAQ
jgi:hypothetical protein